MKRNHHEHYERQPRLISKAKAVREFGLCMETVNRLIADGSITTVTLAKRAKIVTSSLERLIRKGGLK